jgi:hypothetical protein
MHAASRQRQKRYNGIMQMRWFYGFEAIDRPEVLAKLGTLAALTLALSAWLAFARKRRSLL